MTGSHPGYWQQPAGLAGFWDLIPKLASVPFSSRAAEDADQGRPVLVSGSVPEQAAVYRRLAETVARRFNADGK